MSETLRLTPSESVIVRRSEPDVLEVEGVYGPGGSAPPKHLHPVQDERFRVLEGRLMTRVDGSERELSAGEVLDIPRGAVHQMWNHGSAEARVAWETRPAGRTEQWFRSVDALQREAGERSPSPLAFGVLLRSYDDTFRLAIGPPVLGRLVTTALGALGRLRGYRAPAG